VLLLRDVLHFVELDDLLLLDDELELTSLLVQEVKQPHAFTVENTLHEVSHVLLLDDGDVVGCFVSANFYVEVKARFLQLLE